MPYNFAWGDIIAKGNQKAKFSVFNFFDVRLATKLERQITYLDSDEIIARTPQVQQALRDIKARKRVEQFGKFILPNKKAKHKDHYQIVSDQIQRGFDIAHSWNFEEPWWWFTE